MLYINEVVPRTCTCSVARSTDISVFYGYLGLLEEYGWISNVYSILRIFTVPLLRSWHLRGVNYLGACFSSVGG